MLGESKRYVNPEVYMGNALERKVEESMVRMKACFLHNNDAIEKVIVTFFFRGYGGFATIRLAKTAICLCKYAVLIFLIFFEKRI